MRVSFEHFSDTFKQNSSAPFQMCSSPCVKLWHVLSLIDRYVSAKGVGNSSKILQGKKEGRKKETISSILSSLTLLSKKLQESYLSIFSTTETDVTTWINTKMHLFEKRILDSVCKPTLNRNIQKLSKHQRKQFWPQLLLHNGVFSQ